MALLAVVDALLFRLTGREKLVVGSNSANRPRPELEPVVGLFLTQVPFAVDLAGDPTFRELLARVKKSSLAAYTHQNMPFDKLVEVLRPEPDPSRNPVVQVLLLVLAGQSHGGGESVDSEAVPLFDGNSRWDLMFGLYDYDDLGFSGPVEYNADILDARPWSAGSACSAASSTGWWPTPTPGCRRSRPSRRPRERRRPPRRPDARAAGPVREAAGEAAPGRAPAAAGAAAADPAGERPRPARGTGRCRSTRSASGSWSSSTPDGRGSTSSPPPACAAGSPCPWLAAALAEIARRHAAWRTTFPVRRRRPRAAGGRRRGGSGSPCRPRRRLPAARREAEALRLVGEDAAAPFDLERGPLVRASLLRLRRGRPRLPAHHPPPGDRLHLLPDRLGGAGRALRRLRGRPAAARCRSRRSTTPDFAVWQREWLQGEVLEDLVSWWRERLDGFPLALELPTDRPRPAVARMRGGRRLRAASPASWPRRCAPSPARRGRPSS